WLRPRDDRAFSEARKALYRAVPAAARLHRLALWARLEAYYPLVFGSLHDHARFVDRRAARDMRAQLTDPALQDAVVPSYRVGCKRVLLSDDWLPTLERPDVELVTTPIRQVTPGGVLLEDGREVGLDVLICATGYRVDDPLGDLAVHGEGGLGLREAWGDRPSAWMGMAVPRFPDLFLILGPNTALGHSSVILMIEAAARYAAQAVRHGLVVGPRTVRTDAAEAFERWADDAHGEHVWSSGCRSWYQNAAGVNYTLWPGSTWSYIRRTHTFDPSVYRPASM
ncbi:MAG: 4-hydroxyacetophenone monooxygenase, partial [Myxococcales bacterium]|nr:4-hydroxyacetophenone monooxygenase [Myxococcales bacterium]